MNDPTLTDGAALAAELESWPMIPGAAHYLAPHIKREEARELAEGFLASDWLAARVAEAVGRERAIHRDLVSRLGFGDNITEPMADNDTIVAWFEQQSRDASEWQETQLWRNDCYAMGHPQDDDCRECDPRFAVDRERAAWATKIETLASFVETRRSEFSPDALADTLRGLLAADDTEGKP